MKRRKIIENAWSALAKASKLQKEFAEAGNVAKSKYWAGHVVRLSLALSNF